MSSYQNNEQQSPEQFQADGYLNVASQSFVSENRRRYPRDRDGAKNEWKAIVQHQTHVNNQIMQLEKDLKNLRAQDLGQAYDQKLQDQLQMKETQLRQKQNDAQMMNNRIQEYQEEMAKQKAENHSLQNFLNETNGNILKDHQLRSNDEKQKKLESELRQLEENKRRIASEQRRRANVKMEMNNMAHEQLNNHFEKKTHEKEDQLRFRDDYNNMVKKNIQRDVMKEENYRNFYKATAERQKHLGQLHTENTFTDQQKREQEVANTIEKNIIEAKQKALEKEALLKQKREEIQNNLKSTLNYQVGYKNQMRQHEKELRQVETEEVTKKSQEYNKYLQEVKSQQLLAQQNYRDTLAKQHQAWEEQNRSNKMTKDEKKLNFMDLQAYKVADPKLHSLVPGFQHSRYDFNGSLSLKQLNPSVTNSNLMLGSPHNTTNPQIQTDNGLDTRNLSRNNVNFSMVLNPQNSSLLQPREIVASPTYRTSAHNILSNQLNNKYVNPSPLNKVISPKSNHSNDSIFYRPPPNGVPTKQPSGVDQPNDGNSIGPRKNLSISIGANVSSHNPITNPMPFNNQNPYIMRELSGLRPRNEKSNYLANVASANIFASQA